MVYQLQKKSISMQEGHFLKFCVKMKNVEKKLDELCKVYIYLTQYQVNFYQI